VSLAWAAIVGLLAGETPRSREAAYTAFAHLDTDDQQLFLNTSEPNVSRTPTQTSDTSP
jgi:hypothetical protein